MQLPVCQLAQVMLAARKAWEREEKALLWAQPLQKAHTRAEATQGSFPGKAPGFPSLTLGENVQSFLH